MNKINKKVLVTGGNGFLGWYVVELLRQKRNEVVVFDKLKPTNSSKSVHTPQFVKGNILSKDDVSNVFEQYGPFETVYHLASAMPDKIVSDDITWRTNVDGTANMISAAIQHKTKSFIFTSSNVTYGIPQTLPVTELTPLNPIEVYGKSKAQAEKELEKQKTHINIQIFRCPVITGVGRLGLQAILFEFISENRNVYILGGGTNKYQFVDAKDVATALELASFKKGFDIYTIGGDGVMSLRDLYQNVIESAGSSSKIVSLPKNLSIALLYVLDKLNISPLGIYQYTMLSRSLFADTTKIKKKLGWKPEKTNAESFIENYRWYEQNKNTFVNVTTGKLSNNRSLPPMKIFKLLKMLS